MTAQADSASLTDQAQTVERKTLRRQLRGARRALSPAQRRSAAMQLARHIERAGLLTPGTRLGVYLALPEEPNLAPLMKRAWANGCQVFVVNIASLHHRRLTFLPFTATTRVRRQRWGLTQVITHHLHTPVSAATLDAILVPLVGFDAMGHRLGMGAGFYDRYLARRARADSIQRPRLIGVAFQVQAVPHLTIAAHDVHMDAIVTERGFQTLIKPR